jgi:hypothetical protein
MATAFDNTIICSNTTAVLFRRWANFIHNVFLLGLVNVTDAAQVNLDTVAAPSAINTPMGFKVYQTNDAKTPVYIRVDFGSGLLTPTPSIWLTIGTSYTTGGTIGGVILLPYFQLAGGAGNATLQHTCFGSGANNRVCFAMFTNLATSPIWFSFERRKDNNLADVDTGILLDGGLSTTLHWSLCAPFSGVIPVAEKGMQFILSTNNPAAYGTTIPEGLRIPCLGASEAPGLNIGLCMANDYGNYAQPTLNINSVDHLFKHCGPYINALRGDSTGCTDTATRLLLRYE